MTEPEITALMRRAKAWCRAEYGRQRELCAYLGVTEATLSNWLALRKRPSLEKYLALAKFMKSR
jgi:transcriptional regulator with XRE-family HTH domain